MNFRQFNIQFPDLNYAISTSVGKVSFLRFKLDQGDIILESKSFQHLTQISNLRVLDQSTLEVLTNAFEYQKIRYDLQTVSAENDPQIIRTLIKDALEELAISETALKQIEEEEEDLSRKLASVNQTLYAIQSINSKRKRGIPNSLEDTGFEFTLCPVVKSTSLANTCLQPTTYLRVCIKTTKFLQLENWYLALDLFSENNKTGETKTLSVVGFESHYEQGLERYSVWERDVSIEPSQLPLKVTCTLVMCSSNEPLRFPVAEMMVDDLHFAIPCNTDLIQNKTGSYPFARFLRKQHSSQQISKRSFYNNKHVHIRCLIDPSMTDEQYRSILPNLLNEGRTVDEVKLIMNNAEQAYLTLASFPSSPIILLLSKVAVNELDITIQSAHPSALFKAEANLISRLSRCCIKDENQSTNLDKKLKFLEDSVVELQEIYQQDNMELDNDDNQLTNSIKQIIERLYNTYDELPIGFNMARKFVNYFVVPVATLALVGTAIRSQARPAKAHSHFMKPDHQTRQSWRQANGGLSVQDVGRSGGGV
ncbi:hypothetical protein RO3G_01812 [Rhizopus delemar RA 99-880]|uniref:Uncharacterized protein n=2 Tax=Rhizopus delemar TaxID=936053 RepID=I1BLM8_RHIO9|nr:hypothetical protein RO3G_01812 [Rhizopus delemar RA 99-880]|eukprot:EIE77108.1 hypothetical protein RO3G_01812 [Rhizopus delemar RA 99-880]